MCDTGLPSSGRSRVVHLQQECTFELKTVTTNLTVSAGIHEEFQLIGLQGFAYEGRESVC